MTSPRNLNAGQFDALALSSARAALEASNPEQALEWLERVAEAQWPADLAGRSHYEASRNAMATGKWGLAAEHLGKAAKYQPSALYQLRLGLVRKRKPLLEDRIWETLIAKVDPARRLDPNAFQPDVDGAWSCGAYFAWGTARALPWSRFLRLAKNPPQDSGERAAVLSLAGRFFCRFIVEQTPLLTLADVVVPIPAEPERFAQRMVSLPDELALAVENTLGIPLVQGALVTTDKGIELRGLSRWERRRTVIDSMRIGEMGIAESRSVLLVDDVITHGTTVSYAASLLKEAGATEVFAATLSHTEG